MLIPSRFLDMVLYNARSCVSNTTIKASTKEGHSNPCILTDLNMREKKACCSFLGYYRCRSSLGVLHKVQVLCVLNKVNETRVTCVGSSYYKINCQSRVLRENGEVKWVGFIEPLSHLTSNAPVVYISLRPLRPPRLQCFPTPFLEIYPCNTFSDYCNSLTSFCLSLLFLSAAMAIRRSARIRRAQESPEVSEHSNIPLWDGHMQFA